MLRPKAENLMIALGLAILYFVIPNLSYQMKESFAKPLVKQHLNEEITKYDPETERLEEIISPVPIKVPRLSFQELHPPYESLPPSSNAYTTQQITYLPYISTPGGAPAAVAAPPEEAAATPEVPVRLVIPAIGLDAPIVPTKTKVIYIDGGKYRQWLVPNKFAAGWHKNSARLGEPGNTVLNGHHNVYGEVFRRLVDLKEGDLIQVFSENRAYEYIIANTMILPEAFEGIDVRMNNAQWINPSSDERITLITCWPYESNTHRLIIVARPAAPSGFSTSNP